LEKIVTDDPGAVRAVGTSVRVDSDWEAGWSGMMIDDEAREWSDDSWVASITLILGVYM
jgi:hypothetical protein